MNKKELLQKADELIAKANELKELANKEESNVILVPDNIQITDSVCEYGKGIVNLNQQLYYDTKNDNWRVESHHQTDKIKCKLTPCKYKDLKPGDIFYSDDSNNPDFDDLVGYSIKLEEGYQYWIGKNCDYCDRGYDYYWKVEEV